MTDRPAGSLPPKVSQRIDIQLELSRRLREAAGTSAARPAPFVTISRQYGCEAVALAEQLAPQLSAVEKLPPDSWTIYSRQIIEEMGGELGLSNRLLDALDLRARGGIEEFFETLIGQAPPDLKLMHGLIRTIRAVALHGRCVLVGRGGAILTKDLPAGIHIRLVAPEEWRLKNLTVRFGWNRAEAPSRLHAAETERQTYIQKYLGKDPSDVAHYDLMINVARVNRDEQLRTICSFFESRRSRI